MIPPDITFEVDLLHPDEPGVLDAEAPTTIWTGTSVVVVSPERVTYKGATGPHASPDPNWAHSQTVYPDCVSLDVGRESADDASRRP